MFEFGWWKFFSEVCNGRKLMVYVKEMGREWVFFCFLKFFCGERMREKEKKRMF